MTIAGNGDDQFTPVVRQRRRLESMLAGLDHDSWSMASRCVGLTVKDVVAHLAGVNQFWTLSVKQGVAGVPTRLLGGFDPVTTPAAMVEATRDQSPKEVLAQFVESNNDFLGALEALNLTQWEMMAEAPPGHLSVRLVASHALWDSWIHERDIALPLGISSPVFEDEVAASLRYVCALSAAFLVLSRSGATGKISLKSSNPSLEFTVIFNEEVAIHNWPLEPSEATLVGDSVELLEALSYRTPMPNELPSGWREILGGLAAVFDVAGSTI